MTSNLKEALSNYDGSEIFGWTDSTVVLHWLSGNGEYKQFVSNRITKIKSREYIHWSNVPTNENPADIGSRSCPASKIPELWLQGPKWLQYKDQWPVQPTIRATYETEQEAKIIKELMSTTLQENDTFDKLMSKFDLWKCIRVIAWINRFITNCKKKKINGPLTTSKIKEQRTWFTKTEQKKLLTLTNLRQTDST